MHFNISSKQPIVQKKGSETFDHNNKGGIIIILFNQIITSDSSQTSREQGAARGTIHCSTSIKARELIIVCRKQTAVHIIQAEVPGNQHHK